MLKNTQINRAVTKKIAKALGTLNKKVIYVGGAVVSLYINVPAAEDIRPTKDLDLTMKIASLAELETIREEFIKRGFIQSSEDTVLCRFRYEDVLIDVMATEAIGWAPGNRWFKQGFDHTFIYRLDEINIKLLPLTYFLGTKFDAFFDRGFKDPWASHDFEDIVYLLNYSSDIIEQVVHSDVEIKKYIKECALIILGNSQLQQVIIGNLYEEARDKRFDQIMSKLNEIINGI